MAVLYLLLAVPIATAIHVSGMALAAYACGIRFPELQYGSGPVVWRRKIAFFELQVSAFLYGGSVKMGDNLFDHPPSKLIPIALGGNVALVVLAMLIFGPERMGSEFWSFYLQGFQGAFDHQGFAIPLLQTYGERFVEAGFPEALAVLCCKTAALCMTPLPTLNGGVIILSLINEIKPLGQTISGWPTVICALFVWFVTGSWLIAVVRWAI